VSLPLAITSSLGQSATVFQGNWLTRETTGGYANHTTILYRGTEQFILKEFVEETSLQRELMALYCLQGHNFNAPKVVATHGRQVVLSFAGQKLTERDKTEEIYWKLGSLIAKLHRYPPPPALADLPSQASRISDRIRAIIFSEAEPDVLLHGDITWGNCLLHSDDHIYLIDFEESGVGHPLTDLAICCVECCWAPENSEKFESRWNALIDAYERAGGHRISAYPTSLIDQATNAAAEELMNWSVLAGQSLLTQKYESFLSRRIGS
ncbi:phosphotransferase, partial [Elstera litoralis]|uniref:phosphotransferase n=1 Tax=Elstera litoralis TaxID=552518 RepID=UPI0012EE3987